MARLRKYRFVAGVEASAVMVFELKLLMSTKLFVKTGTAPSDQLAGACQEPLSPLFHMLVLCADAVESDPPPRVRLPMRWTRK